MEEVLLADGGGHVGFGCGVDVEGVGDAGGGDFDGFSIFGGEGSIFEGGLEEIDYGEGELLLGVEGGSLEDVENQQRFDGFDVRERGLP